MSTAELTVCHVMNSLENGGAQNLLLNLVRNTDDRIDYLVGYHNESEKSIENELIANGAHTFQLEHSFLFDLRAVSHLNAVVDRHDVDILHAHLPYQQLLARWSGTQKAVPVVGTHHNLGNTPHPAILSLEKASRRLEDRTIGVTESVRRAHTSSVLDRGDQWEIVYNGIDVEAFNERVGAHDTDETDETTYLTIGKYIAEKAQERQIDAMETLVETHPDSRLYIVGWGPLEDELRNAVSERGLEDRIEVTGYTDEPERYYAMADAYLSSAPAEGHPMTIIEAMSAGLPVVAQDYEGAREVVADGETGILATVDDQASFVDAMAQLQSESRRRELGENGYQRALSRFDIGKTAADHSEIYTSLLPSDATSD